MRCVAWVVVLLWCACVFVDANAGGGAASETSRPPVLWSMKLRLSPKEVWSSLVTEDGSPFALLTAWLSKCSYKDVATGRMMTPFGGVNQEDTEWTRSSVSKVTYWDTADELLFKHGWSLRRKDDPSQRLLPTASQWTLKRRLPSLAAVLSHLEGAAHAKAEADEVAPGVVTWSADAMTRGSWSSLEAAFPVFADSTFLDALGEGVTMDHALPGNRSDADASDSDEEEDGDDALNSGLPMLSVDHVNAAWKAYKERFHKRYETDASDAIHRALFARNLARIELLNAHLAPGELAFDVSEFADEGLHHLAHAGADAGVSNGPNPQQHLWPSRMVWSEEWAPPLAMSGREGSGVEVGRGVTLLPKLTLWWNTAAQASADQLLYAELALDVSVPWHLIVSLNGNANDDDSDNDSLGADEVVVKSLMEPMRRLYADVHRNGVFLGWIRNNGEPDRTKSEWAADWLQNRVKKGQGIALKEESQLDNNDVSDDHDVEGEGGDVEEEVGMDNDANVGSARVNDRTDVDTTQTAADRIDAWLNHQGNR